jgi:CubicO group peptidase (beta-lactamase class C family)
VRVERTGALGVEAAAVDDRAAENTPVPGEELARRVDDDVGAELDRPEKVRVANVLSMTSGMPWRWATAAMAGMSRIRLVALEIDSANRARVSGRIAASQASASSMSATNVVSMPSRAMLSRRRPAVPS